MLRFDDRTAGLLLGLHDGLLDPDYVADPLVCPKPRPKPITTSFKPPGARPETPPPSAKEPRILLVYSASKEPYITPAYGASEEPYTVYLNEPEEPYTEYLDVPPCYKSLVEERA
jgi:hypothetical protein